MERLSVECENVRVPSQLLTPFENEIGLHRDGFLNASDYIGGPDQINVNACTVYKRMQKPVVAVKAWAGRTSLRLIKERLHVLVDVSTRNC